MKTIMAEMLSLEKTKMTEYGINKWTIKIEFHLFEEKSPSQIKARTDYFRKKLLDRTRREHDVSHDEIGDWFNGRYRY
jgi:hypothetical protein